jgi:ABC-type glycerol-3-phosphate transport system substrate-binding protein
MTSFQRWNRQGFVDPNADDKAFLSGRSAISWVGHWVYGDYAKAFGGDLAIVPLPNFGGGTRTGMGSWQWGITSNAKNGDAAWAFIDFLLRTPQVVATVKANGAIPATKDALAVTPAFRPEVRSTSTSTSCAAAWPSRVRRPPRTPSSPTPSRPPWPASSRAGRQDTAGRRCRRDRP